MPTVYVQFPQTLLVCDADGHPIDSVAASTIFSCQVMAYSRIFSIEHVSSSCFTLKKNYISFLIHMRFMFPVISDKFKHIVANLRA